MISHQLYSSLAMNRGTLLIVGDDASLVEALRGAFELHMPGLQLCDTSLPEEALEILEARPVAAVLSDIKLPQMSGYELLARIKARRPTLPVVLMSAYDRPEFEFQQADAFLEKPFDRDKLFHAIQVLP